MMFRDLTTDEIHALVGGDHGTTGVAYPPAGLQPYYDWLVRTVHKLAESSAGALRVARDDQIDTAVYIAPGRASIGGVALAYGGGTIDLAAFNNDTAYLWFEDDAGAASIGVAGAATGWPAGAHIKLAEATLATGQITAVLDRRFETILKA